MKSLSKAMFAIGVALALAIGLGGQPVHAATVNENLFIGEWNNFVGTGGEVLVNLVLSGDDPSTPGFDPDGVIADPDLGGPIPPHLIQRVDVGDRFAGMGQSNSVVCESCPPGPGTTNALGSGGNSELSTLRAMEVTGKVPVLGGFKLTLSPLTSAEFSSTIFAASGGAVTIPVATIPVGTMVMAFDDPTPDYTVLTISGSPGENWVRTTNGTRQWNGGFATPENFWTASLPSDDLGLLSLLPPTFTAGTVTFGLSQLSGGAGLPLQSASCPGPTGTVQADFCMTTTTTGTSGIDTPFPVGLITEVRFHPLAPVGGTTELLVGDPAAPAESADSFGGSKLPIAAAAGGALVALAIAGLYVRRRIVR